MVHKLLGLGLVSLALTACGATEKEAAPAASSEPATALVNKDLFTRIDTDDLVVQMMAGTDMVPYETVCKAAGGEVEEGDQVVIRDAGGETLAIGSTDAGAYGEDDGGTMPMRDVPCIFTISIEDVPLGEKFYEIQVGDSTAITVTQAELTDPDTSIEIG